MLDFKRIKDGLLSKLRTYPDAWTDYFRGSVGDAILSLIAFVRLELEHRIRMNRLDTYLDTAVSDEAIYRLAAQRGVLVPPAYGGIWLLKIKPKTEPYDLTLNKFDIIGTYNDYEVIVISDVSYSSLTKDDTVLIPVTVAKLSEYNNSNTGYSLNPNTTLEIVLGNRYPIEQLEKFEIYEGGEWKELYLLTSLDTSYELDRILLRRVQPFKVYIYTGNGLLGYANGSVQWKYTVAAFSNDLLNNYENISHKDIDWSLNNLEILEFKLTQSPRTLIPAHKLKTSAIYHPYDSRLVADSDYDSVLLSQFSTLIEDVFTETIYEYDSDLGIDVPVTYIRALLNPSLGSIFPYESSAWQTVKNTLLRYIDSKRALGVKLKLYLLPAGGDNLPPVDDSDPSKIDMDVLSSHGITVPVPYPYDEYPDDYDDLTKVLAIKIGVMKNQLENILGEFAPRILFKISRETGEMNIPRILAEISAKLGTPVVNMSTTTEMDTWYLEKYQWYRGIIVQPFFLDSPLETPDPVIIGYLFRPEWNILVLNESE